jgi:hypothetical protein
VQPLSGFATLPYLDVTLFTCYMQTRVSELLGGGHWECRSVNEQCNQDDDGNGYADKE